MTDELPYNPLHKRNLGKSVAEALLDRPDFSLGDLPQFKGAGIYVIYYAGDYPLYRPISEENHESLRWPIYIGKAVPSGARRGASLSSEPKGKFLYGRLSQHRESIEAVSNLDIRHFQVRYLTVDDIWIPLGESLLISTFKPIWNQLLDGFGNHAPGSGREAGMRPLWDTLHPGRAWAGRLREHTEAVTDIEARVAEFLEKHRPPRNAHMKFTQ